MSPNDNLGFSSVDRLFRNEEVNKNKIKHGNSLVVQWSRLRLSTARGMGLIPGRGTRIPHATLAAQKFLEKRNEVKTRGKAR